jgi:guanylate kinase
LNDAPKIYYRRRGLMLVLSSPSGAGKTTISRALLERDKNLTMSVSVTTRPMRPGEKDGVDYHFIDEAKFHTMVERHELLEHAHVFGRYYGTPRGPVEAALAQGTDVLFDIDWQGTQQLAQNDSTRGDLVSIFILPPTMAELESRLRRRAQDPEDVVRGRMAKAADEMSHYAEYEYVVLNQDVDRSVEQVSAIVTAERSRRSRQTGLHDFVESLKPIA